MDHYSDPCSRDILRTVVHGVVSLFKSCDNSTVIDEITDKIVRLVPELNSQDYLVIVCPATGTSNSQLECLYSIHITERRNDMMVTNSRLTRLSVAALQSTFTTVSVLHEYITILAYSIVVAIATYVTIIFTLV